MKKLYFLLFILIGATSYGQVIYDADFSNDGDGFSDHTTSTPPAPAPASVTGGTSPNDWTLRYETTPGTDGSANSFSVSGGALVSDDWGGQGIFESALINVSALSSVNISAISVNSGANDDNFTYFYILDGGSRVETVIGETNNGDPVNYSVTGLDVSGANTLVVGFEFSENGGGDGYTTSSFQVINAVGCSISSVMASAVCNGNDAEVTVNFSAANASGSYEVSIDGGMWQPITDGGTVTITGPTSAQNGVSVEVRDANETTCSGSSTVDIPICPEANTCFDLSNGPEAFELVTIQENGGFTNNGVWANNTGTYRANGFCGGGCAEQVESWLVFGPLDMSGVTDLALVFDAAEGFGVTDLTVNYTSAYSGCPDATSWTVAQTITDAGSVSVDLSAAMGTDVFIGIQYVDDGADGYSDWQLSNVALEAFGACPTLGARPTSDCALCDVTLGTESYVCLSNTVGDNNDNVTVEIPYTGSDNTIVSVSTTSTGSVSGSNPAVDVDGTITITGLGEGDAWDITINGGDCDGTTISGTIPASICDPSNCPNLGDIIITEIMQNPTAVDDTVGEWFEVYNTTGAPIDLQDWTISDLGADSHTITTSVVVPANGYAVLGVNADSGTNGSVTVDYEYSGITLSNSDDEIILTCGMNVIDQVNYDGGPNFPDPAGASMALSTTAMDSVANDNGANWGTSITEITAGGDSGTPGSANDFTLSADQFEATDFSVYPNPTSAGFINITTSNSDAMNVTVYDMLGKQVKNETVSNNRLDVSNLNTGIYILKITQNDASTTKKLVVRN